jgi:hypothetical protein
VFYVPRVSKKKTTLFFTRYYEQYVLSAANKFADYIYD